MNNFSSIITKWYKLNKRDLPWRETTNPYIIWLSEIILQQTQVKQGLPYFEKFVNNFPSIKILANAEEEEVLKLWEGLGYYSRARNLHATAKYVSKELNGKFPDNYKEIIKLKGIGDYTASAISSFAFKEQQAVLDGNVYRVLSRIFGIETAINTTSGNKEFKKLATDLICKEKPDLHNQAIMEFGALQCKPKNPDCIMCPVNNACFAYINGKIQLLPVKLKTIKKTKKNFNFLVVLDNDKNVVIEKRVKGIWRNLYQFPLVETDQEIKIDNSSDLKIKEHININNYEIYLFNEKPINHKLSHLDLNIKFWIVETNDNFKNKLPYKEIEKHPFPIVLANFIKEFRPN